MAIEYIADHVSRALGNMLSQFSESQHLQDLVAVLVEGVQQVEDVTFDLVASRMIDTAANGVLDQYGEVLVEPRDGLNDADYRLILLTKIQANKASGRIDEITDVFAKLMKTVDVTYTPLYPAGYQLTTVCEVAPTQSINNRASRFLEDMTPAGVALSFAAHTTGPGYFSFAGDPNGLAFGEGELLTEIVT
jgi:hypothetical protein